MLIVLRENNSARHQHDTERTQNRAGKSPARHQLDTWTLAPQKTRGMA